MPLIYNSWGAFIIDEERVFVGRSSSIGVELFVTDDGWFAKRDNTCSWATGTKPDQIPNVSTP